MRPAIRMDNVRTLPCHAAAALGSVSGVELRHVQRVALRPLPQIDQE